jgi:UDP-N-acetylenolpyruvoylglucosamine reductase
LRGFGSSSQRETSTFSRETSWNFHTDAPLSQRDVWLLKRASIWSGVIRSRSGAASRRISSSGIAGNQWSGGRACISPKHGNFIINLGRATAVDVLALIRVVQRRVHEDTGVELELEVQAVGEE